MKDCLKNRGDTVEKIPPQQQLFNAIFSASLKLGYETFDYLPPQKQALPFVFIGEQFDQDKQTKRFLYGDIQQTIHIYHDIKRRGELTEMMLYLKESIRKIKKTNDFSFTCKQVDSQTLTDTTDSIPLLHGIIETDFTFN